MEELIRQGEGVNQKEDPVQGGTSVVVNNAVDGSLHGLGSIAAICATRSDSMSVDSTSENELASVGGAPEEMDTEDSEKDMREAFGTELSGLDGPKFVDCKEACEGMRLAFDNQKNIEIMERGTMGEGAVQEDVTSPVIENKMSDDVEGYYMMRTRLFSQSAVILENGAALKKDNSTGLCGSDRANSNYESEGDSEKNTNTLSLEMEGGDVNHSGDAASVCVDRLSHQGETKINETSEGGNIGGCRTQQNPSSDTLEGKVTDSEAGGNEEAVMQTDGTGRSATDAVKVEAVNEKEHHLHLALARVEGEEESAGALASAYIMDSSASESIAEVEKSGLEAKLARVSKRRVYSKAREVSKDAESSSESDSDSESEDEDKDMFHGLYEAKVLINVAQPDSQKMIKRETIKMACTDDLLSDYISSEDSSASSTDSSSGDSDSDSDDSSDSDLSSVESDDDFDERKGGKQGPPPAIKMAKEVWFKDLPEVEYIDITLPEDIQLKPLGCVSSIIGSLVIIQAERGTPALNIESVLFKDDRKVLGQVFEIFGPVVSPFYSVRFNNPKDLEEKGVVLKMMAFYAPQHIDTTQYVFTEQLINECRGSDASWKNDEEPPDNLVDYSDDDAERSAKNKRKGGKDKRKRKVPRGRNENGFASSEQRCVQGYSNGKKNQDVARLHHPPLQRQPPPQAGPFPPNFPPPHPGMFAQPPVGPNQFQDQQNNMENPAFRPSNVRGRHPGFSQNHVPPGPWCPNGEFPHGQFDRNNFRPRQSFGGPPRMPQFPFPGPHQPMFQNPLVAGPQLPRTFRGVNSTPTCNFGPGSGGGPAQQQCSTGSDGVRGGSHSNQQRKHNPQPKQNQKFTAGQSSMPPQWHQIPPPPPASASLGGFMSGPPQMNGAPPKSIPTLMQGSMPFQNPPHSNGLPPKKGPSVRAGFDPRFRPPKKMNPFPSANLPPPPVPPPSFHPRMMQSFGGPHSFGGPQH